MRLDLAGDGTDLEPYSRRYGGLAINVTINKFVYVVVTPTGDQPSQMSSSSDFVSLFGSGDGSAVHPDLAVPQAVLQRFGMSHGVSVFVAMQVPAGTGLGASTASGLALACALGAASNKPLAANEAAELVATADPGYQSSRRQDAYAIAFGGLSASSFRGQSVSRERIEVAPTVWRQLEEQLILFYTGRPQNSDPIWAEEKKGAERNRASVIESLHLIKRQAEQLLAQLQEGDLSGLGSSLDATWQAKKRLARTVTDAWIDQWYQTAVDAGASGGKVCGAGGGGFLLLSCEPRGQERVTQALEAAGLVRVDFQLETNGAALLMQRELDSRINEIAAHRADHVSSN